MRAQPMLARAAETLPVGAEWVYEPKWDGFRAIVSVHADHVAITGRNGGRLEDRFPELAPALSSALPPGTTLDGELVAPTNDGVDFDALLRRLSSRGARAEHLAALHPVAYVAFDVLRLRGIDVAKRPFAQRRDLLTSSIGWGGSLSIATQTRDPSVANVWLTEFLDRGIEGVVAKRLDQPYLAGRRALIKVKPDHSVDCVVGGFRGDWNVGGILLLGLYRGHELAYAGRTSVVGRSVTIEAMNLLDPIPDSPFRIGAPGRGRWEHRFPENEWQPVAPSAVSEVGYTAVSSGAFRHSVRWRRWRPDKDPRECVLEQLYPNAERRR